MLFRKFILSSAAFLLCVMFTGATVTAQANSSQKWTISGWKQAVPKDIHVGSQVTTEVIDDVTYYLLRTEGVNVFRVRKDDPSISDEEKEVFEDALNGGGGIKVTVGDGPTIGGVSPN